MSQEVKILGWGTIYVYYNISQTTEAISGIYCKVFPDEQPTSLSGKLEPQA